MTSESNDSKETPQPSDGMILAIPAFKGMAEIKLDVSKTREAESRMLEVKMVNPVTFAGLNHMLGESYRELKRHMATVGYQIAMAEKASDQAKAEALLDTYPDFLKANEDRIQDNGDTRKAYLARDKAYVEAQDRIAMLKAIESFVEGRIKVMERATSFMNRQIDVVIKSGLANQNLYITSGRK